MVKKQVPRQNCLFKSLIIGLQFWKCPGSFLLLHIISPLFKRDELSECNVFNGINVSCTAFHVSLTWLKTRMRVAGSGCDCSAALGQGRSCLSKHAQQEKLKESKPKAHKICSRWSKQMMWLSREIDFSGELKLFVFCCSHVSEYFLRSLQDFDGKLKYTQVETLTRKEFSLTGPYQLNIQHIKVFFLCNSWILCASAGYQIQETPNEKPGRTSGIYPAEINLTQFTLLAYEEDYIGFQKKSYLFFP